MLSKGRTVEFLVGTLFVANFCTVALAIYLCALMRYGLLYCLMGNISEKINSNKYELSLGALALTLGSFAYYQRGQNAEVSKIANALDPEIPSVSQKRVEIYEEIDQKIIYQELVKYRLNPIYRIAITGGPCAGKSTALDKICDHFSKAGFHVMVVPEVPTLVAYGGGLSDFPRYGSRERMKFQLDLMKLKIYFEDYIAQLAEMSKKPTIVLCDRGLVDCAAYMSKEEYQALLDEQGWTWSQLRDKRYDSVIFMNTAAKGAEEFYTLANNSARTETAEQARALDNKTLNAWVGHPYMTICPNIKGKSFSYKVDLAIKAVQKTIGLESTKLCYHKLLIEYDQIPEGIVTIQSDIEQIYLKNQSQRYVQDKIKKRGQDNSYTYQRKYVGRYSPQRNFREVVRVSLNSLQYATLAEQEKDPRYRPVHIKRINFSVDGYYFAIDEIDNVKGYPKARFLRFQADFERDISDVIPSWIKVIKDVRSESEFKLSQIAYMDY